MNTFEHLGSHKLPAKTGRRQRSLVSLAAALFLALCTATLFAESADARLLGVFKQLSRAATTHSDEVARASRRAPTVSTMRSARTDLPSTIETASTAAWRAVSDQRSFLKLDVKIDATAVRFSNTFVSLPDILSLTLSIGLDTISGNANDPVIVEIAGNRISGRSAYTPVVCIAGGRTVAVLSDTYICPDGTAPQIWQTLDISKISIRKDIKSGGIKDQIQPPYDLVSEAGPAYAPFYTKLKLLYPETYDSINKRMGTDLQSTDTVLDIYQSSDGFWKSESRYAQYAEPGVLSAMAVATYDSLKVLQSESKGACADIIIHGRITPQNFSGLAMDAHFAYGQASTIALDVFNSGRRNPQDYLPVSDDNWAELLSRLLSHKVKLAEVERLAQGDLSELSEDRICALGTALYDEIASLPSAWRARVMSEISSVGPP